MTDVKTPTCSDEMVDSDECHLYLDNLFFEKPVVHKVKPLHQEVSPWQLEVPPSLSQIPATQDMQEESESLSSLYRFSQTPQKILPSFKGSVDLNTLPSKSKHSHSFNNYGNYIEEIKYSNNINQCDNFWGGEGFRVYFQNGFQSGRGEEDKPELSGYVAVGQKCFPVNLNKSAPVRRSLFKDQVLNSGGDSSNTDDLSSNGSSSQTASGPQTFLSQVTMATAPPPHHHQPPRAPLSRAAPPLSLNPPLPPPPRGSSAASSRPPQQAAHAEIQDKGTKRAFVPPMTPQPFCIKGSSEVLRPVSEIPAKFRSVFNDFPFFNYVQSKALDDTGKNFVACAPTGSGKTVLFELAIVRLLMGTSEPWGDVRVVYMAPIKALCSQCFGSWKKKFGPLGLRCKELTGDTEIDDFFEIHDSHIILTTPEKWDSMTRKWKDNCLLQLVRLFLIDEMHVVKDAIRGATLEVVVSRMKAVNAYRTAQNPEGGLSMRFVAVSATMPNISDIADWLSDESGAAMFLNMDESHRPVKLRKVVLGFPCTPNQTEFKFDLSLNYKMANIIQMYSDQKPTLVFCSTRKGTQQAAAILARDAGFMMSIEHKQRLMKYANSILDSKLRDLVMFGVGFHHAGVDLSDRKLIETAFIQGDLQVLFTTRTLAMGVNLPAHLVVIKSTMQYVSGSCEEYSEADLLQMIGRAGRPQFDTSATAVIMTKSQTKEKYSTILNGTEVIESSLHSHLVEHLNAEIALHTISNVNMALDWIRSTFLYIRALKNPTHYGFSANLDRCGIEAKLQELCLKNLNSLSSIGLINMDEDINIKPTEAGKLMAKYCVAFDTMKQFSLVSGTENLSDLIQLVSKSREYSDIQLRVNEKRPLNTLNRDKNHTTIRFPLEGKIKSSDMKVNCLIQAQLGSISVQDFALTQDTSRIFRNGMRIVKCLAEFLSQRSETAFTALLNALILAKCFRAKIWENSPYISKQLEKIGQTLSTAMANAGLTTFSKIEQTNAREIELIVNRHPPFGNQIRESVIHLPKYEITFAQLQRYSCATAEVVVKVNLKNQAQLLTKRTAPEQHYVTLIIGDSDNNVVFLQKLTDLLLLKCGTWMKRIEVSKALKGDEISINLISSEYVGLDIQQKFNLFFSKEGKSFGATDSCQIQASALKPDATNQAEEARSTAEQGSKKKRQCNHFCKNKDMCGHDCCKVGVIVSKKRAAHQEFAFYLNDLRNRCDTLMQTPVKRLKMKMKEEPVFVNTQEFAYKPKERMSVFSRNENYSETPLSQHSATADVKEENVTELPDIIVVDDLNDFNDLVENMHMMVQTPAASHSKQEWTNPTLKFGVSPTPKPQTTPINTSSAATSKTSPSALNWGQIPPVSFDLGNEWDDWGDFDDDSLVHATESLLAVQSVEHMTGAGYPHLSAPRITSAAAPLRSIPAAVKSEFRKPGPSTVTVRPQHRLTLDLNKNLHVQRPSVFSNELIVETPENIPKHTEAHLVPLTQRFDFFSQMNGPVCSTSSDNVSTTIKEEEAFLGIFDGLF